ncbi:hypothetical protein K461DRAFT_284915 [Myriangium duriaei CBS 260.36]|uniref:Phosphatidylcholine-hydrolyzing phospholipase C n=1 Tax=Myriangium duriaei CBS 260.36 TaxID=1168546 RepID=A0A9P4J7B9_9PEZI|nr:hypothetical protein K461DRAFT_284915 [Myriangium duriaei CBS 260.36]
MDISRYSSAALEQLHHSGAHLNVSFRGGPSLTPIASNGTAKLDFEYAEHGFLGDAITLTLGPGQTALAGKTPFTLPNGLSLTYGQINGVSGLCCLKQNLVATDDHSSDGINPTEQSARFLESWGTLATDKIRQPTEAKKLLGVLEGEVAAVNKAVGEGRDPANAYANLADPTARFEAITADRPHGQPSYLKLAEMNFDHFGYDARTAYNAGHMTALQQAVMRSNDYGNLILAYTLNAFADHFLEDSFSAGHVRTPRRYLHSNFGDADLCAKAMHDEDNSIGLSVNNSMGQVWTMYGDKRLLDKANQVNRQMALQAVQVSANEIYQAWLTRTIPNPADFGAWKIAPTLASCEDENQALAPLFTPSKHPKRRKNIEDRHRWRYTSDYWFWTTLLSINLSGLWKYPIHM